MEGSPRSPVTLRRRLKYLMIRGVHRLMSMYPYDDTGRREDPELEASVRKNEEGLIVATSLVPGAGLGLFADRDYEPGEVVCTYIGTPLTLLQMLRTRDWTYMMDCGKDRRGQRIHIDAHRHPRPKGAFINHHFDSSKHNIFCDELPDDRKCLMIASRQILRGEELYMDYGPKYWHTVAKPPATSVGDGGSRPAPLQHRLARAALVARSVLGGGS